ncbi:RNA polymerase sigma factor [Lentzea kentuckyensis]|uniref:RNA polymerase sigma factor n=1 Tax=Lentzea kentuckyensis TaxID=360086 RepID=UPI000A378DED|nr:sigma-70 family RNA polymerase sigma factor [Lentzea kentuckyensis]
MTPSDSDEHAVAFSDFYHRERTRMCRFAATWSPGLDHEAAVQDAFVSAWRNWRSIEPSRRCAWLVTAIRNSLIDQARRLRERPGVLSDELIARHGSAFRILVQRHRDAEISQELTATLTAISGLPETLRTALALRFWSFDYEQIAEVLGCDRDAARVHVSRARAQVSAKVGNPDRRVRNSRRGVKGES